MKHLCQRAGMRRLGIYLAVLFVSLITAHCGRAQATGQLQVNEVGYIALFPSQAIFVLDSGSSFTIGSTITVPVGGHTVAIEGANPYQNNPPIQDVTVLANQTVSVTGTFTYTPVVVTVTILPAAAVAAGAEYNVDGGPWQPGSATIFDSNVTVSAGFHVFNYSTVPGYTTPASQRIDAFNGGGEIETTGTYTSNIPGSLTVTINPPGAVSAGGEWNVDGGAVQPSGATVSGLAAGSHTVAFTQVAGYIPAASQSVTIVSGSTTQVSAAYVASSTITVNLVPDDAVDAGAAWTLDNGQLQTSGTTLTGLSPGFHTITYVPVLGYFTPPSQSVSISPGQGIVVTGTYVAPATVTVNLTPPEAVAAGAAWSINGGTVMTSGSSLSGLLPGSYTIDYNSISGYLSPANQNITVSAGQSLVASGTYTLQSFNSSVTVGLSPPGAVAAGAQWSLDGGTQMLTGSTVSGLSNGTHTISFSNVAGYNTPGPQTVNLATNQSLSLSGSYSLPVGSVAVSISPPAAVAAGASWYVDSGAVQLSGTTLAGVTAGAHTLNFTSVAGYNTPASQPLNVSANQLTSMSGTYTVQTASLSVSITPPGAVSGGATWSVDSGNALLSGSTASGLSIGSHTVNFSGVTGYDTPAPQVINLSGTQSLSLTGSYNAQTGSLTVNISPPGAINSQARWTVDSGTTEFTSGATDAGLLIGVHQVNFNSITDYTAPAAQAILISHNQIAVVSGTYVGEPIINLVGEGDVQLDNGTGSVDFGPVITGSSAQQSFEIVNAGTAPLTNLSLRLSGTNSANFQVGTLTSGSIGIGGSAAFGVTFTALNSGLVNAALTIGSNDPATPAFSVMLIGSGSNGLVNMAKASGLYSCLIDPTGSGALGLARFDLSSVGAVTGRIDADGVKSAVKGKFNADGVFTGTPKALGLTLTSGSGGISDSAGYSIEGNLVISGTTSFTAWHAAYTSAQTSMELPRYTILLTNTDTVSGIPQGTGFATLTVARHGGAITITGKLADDQPITFAGDVFNTPWGHQVYIFDDSLYSSRGFLGGTLTFEALRGSDCDGALVWQRPTSKNLYPNGFATTLTASGAKYTPASAGISPLVITTGTLTFSDGGLPSALGMPILMEGAGKWGVTGPNPDLVKISINATKGSFSGSFIHPVTNKQILFSGLLDQNAESLGAAGFFVGPKISGTSLSGNVLLAP